MPPTPTSLTPRFPLFWQFMAIGLFAAVVLGSLAPISFHTGGSIPHFDKLLHFTAYALLTAGYLAIFPAKMARIGIPLFMFAVGVGIEWLQGMTGYRSASLADAGADLLGILLAARLLVTPVKNIMILIENQWTGHVPASTKKRRRRRKLRYLALWQIIGLHLAIMVLLTAFLPIELDQTRIPHLDKILHFLVWGTLTAWFLLVFPGRKRGALIAAAMLGLSITLESMQGLTPFGGDPSLFDVLADLVGICVAGILIFSPLKRLLLRIERKLSPARYRRRRARMVSASPYQG